MTAGGSGTASSLQPGQRVPTGAVLARLAGPARRRGDRPRYRRPAAAASRRFWFSMLQLANLFLLAPIGFAAAVELLDSSCRGRRSHRRGPGSLQRVGPDPVRPDRRDLARAVLRRDAHRSGVRPHRSPARAQAVRAAGRGARALRHPLLGRTGSSRRTTNVDAVHRHAGRQLVHRRVPDGDGLRPVRRCSRRARTSAASSGRTRPTCTRIGTGTMVSDGSERAQRRRDQHVVPHLPGQHRRAQLPGQHASPGPPAARVGDNVLLGNEGRRYRWTARSGTTSGCSARPRFEIPRTVQRDSGTSSATPSDLRNGLSAKNRLQPAHHGPVHARALDPRVFVVLVIGVAAVDLHDEYGTWALAAGFLAATAFGLTYAVLVERIAGGFRRLHPEAVLDLRPVLLVARAAVEAAGHAGRSPAPPSSRCSPGCSAYASGRRVLDDWAARCRRRPWSSIGESTSPSTKARSSSATRSRTGSSSPTGPCSARA